MMLFYRYTQKSAPAVIFISGLGDGGDSWSGVQDRIAALTTTLSYDRAGIGASTAASGPRTCDDLVQELHRLLSKLAVEPPYILVGHSFGGLVARQFAAKFRSRTAGLVLVDGVPEYKELAYEEVLPVHLIPANRAYLENPLLNSENIDKLASYRQIAETELQWPGTHPMSIITRGLPDEGEGDWPSTAILELEQKLQRGFLRWSAAGRQRIAGGSGHYIHHDEPEIVIEEITAMIAQCTNRPEGVEE
ncbi:alpha/beta fold hydrolase [Paenibacillus sp. sgz500992]|uniref:alpha/beta fold hydrolase n=1 Tax=Paenibacillus sp. sgz500992 TaxID=3242476 RepID=UPI0036D365AA